MNVGPDHLSRIETGEQPTSIEDKLPDSQLFSIKFIEDYFTNIIQFLSIGMVSMEYTTKKKKELVVRVADFSLIVGHLYKMGLDEVLSKYVPEHERQIILIEAHGGITGGHYAGKSNA